MWQQAMDFVQPSDEGEVGALAASCLGAGESWPVGTCGARSRVAGGESGVGADDGRTGAGQHHAASALGPSLGGEWQESIAVVRRAVETLGEADEATRMLGTLIRIAAAGHVAEMRDLMADTRLTKDLEPLWHAARLELGESVGPLPAEIKESVMGIRERLNPQ